MTQRIITAIIISVALFFSLGYSYAQTDPIVTESTTDSTVTTTTSSTSQILSPPPSAISPSINGSNSDLCTVGVSSALQTQILGISGATTHADLNCERLKIAKTLYDMGMKVAAVSTLCQDERVFQAMWYAGTPCPIDGKIGDEAEEMWIDAGTPGAIVFTDSKIEEPVNEVESSFNPALLIGALAALFIIGG